MIKNKYLYNFFGTDDLVNIEFSINNKNESFSIFIHLFLT